MQEFLLQNGYPALFLLSFLASTLIPLGSEWLLVVMLLNRHDPVVSVLTASAGNYLGACATYGIGFGCGPFVARKILRMDERSQLRAKGVYERYGPLSLLFSWLPVIGDPLCLAAGLARLDLLRFSLPVIAGKTARYAFIAWMTVPS